MGNSSRRAAAQAFYKNVLESSSYNESDDETDLLIAAAGMVNEHYLMLSRKSGSSKEAPVQLRSRLRSWPSTLLQVLF
jgi:hypothetical protein